VSDKKRNIEAFYSGIVSQDVPVRILTHLTVAGRLPGTFLFSGPGGVGKLATAIAFAKSLHCSKGGKPDCDCPECSAIRSGTHPDVIVSSKDRHFGVDEMRELVALAGLRSGSGHERVIILDRAELITQAASNAALKALEEPGDHVRFILITDTPASLLSTIRSRAYALKFSLVGDDELARFAEMTGDDPESAETRNAIRIAGGRPGRYFRLKHMKEYVEVTSEIEGWLSESFGRNGTASVEIALKWKDAFWQFADRLSSAERDAAVPRGYNAYEIGDFIKNPDIYGTGPINWQVEERKKKTGRYWTQGRQALLLAGTMSQLLASQSVERNARPISRIHDFIEKVKFNCSFDISVERLYFHLAKAL